MRLYAAQVPIIAREIVRGLLDAEYIELEDGAEEEAELDAAGVLREYIRVERDIGRQARESTVGEAPGAEQREKRRLAKAKNFKLGEDALEYIQGQVIEMFLQSNNVAEVFADDRQMRVVIAAVMKKHARDRSDELDIEVRSKLKNLEDGSSAFNIEYEKAMAQVKRIKGLE